MPRRARPKRLIVVRFRTDRTLWEVDYRDVHGRRHRPLFATEADALARAADLRKELEQGVAMVDDPDLTLRGFAEGWLDVGTQEMEPKTRASYRQLLDGHVLPQLGAIKLRELHRRHVKALIAAKRAAGYREHRAPDQGRLSTVLSDAVDDGYLPTNPAFGAGRKRGKRAEALTATERLQKIRPMTWEDRDAILAVAAPSRRSHALLSVLLKAGLRPGEAFALAPGDLDLTRCTLRVERAVTMGGRIKDTKTHEVRDVDLTPDLALTLRRYLTWLRAEALQKGQGEPERLSLSPTVRSWTRITRRASSDGSSSRPSCKPTACTTAGTRTRAYSWRAVLRSRTWRRSSGTRARPRRFGTTRSGYRAEGSGGWTCWIARPAR